MFQDGNTLAVGLDSNNRRKVYITGSATRVWRVDGDSMTVEPGPLPDPFTQHEGHPRMRVFNGVLYILQKHGLNIHANRLNAATDATTSDATAAATDAFGEASNLGSGIAIQNGPPFRSIWTRRERANQVPDDVFGF